MIIVIIIDDIWAVFEVVIDLEILVFIVIDLGIICDVKLKEDSGVEVIIILIYFGCLAMNIIEINICVVFQEYGYDNVIVIIVLYFVWIIDWMIEVGC